MNQQVNSLVAAAIGAVATYFVTRYLQDNYPSKIERMQRKALKEELKARKQPLVTYHVPE